jgi:alpha-aminoadipate carrier protein LysW
VDWTNKNLDGGDSMNCLECDAALSIPADAIQGEIVSCKDCGASYELIKDDSTGLLSIRPAELEEEDWGE